MISLLLGFLPLAKIIQAGLDIGYSLIIKVMGLIFYLASEYWGRWVLFVIVVLLSLLYGRYHYIQQGRTSEIHFCDLRIDDALRNVKKSKNGASQNATPDFSISDWFRSP